MPTEIYVDGASAGNPGPSGIGIFIKHEGTAESFSIPIGVHTNQEAEFLALIEGMAHSFIPSINARNSAS